MTPNELRTALKAEGIVYPEDSNDFDKWFKAAEAKFIQRPKMNAKYNPKTGKIETKRVERLFGHRIQCYDNEGETIDR